MYCFVRNLSGRSYCMQRVCGICTLLWHLYSCCQCNELLCTTALFCHVDCCDSCLVLLPFTLSSMLTFVPVQQINWLIRGLQRNVDRGHLFEKAALVHKIRKRYLYLHCTLRRGPRAPAHTRSLAIALQSLFYTFTCLARLGTTLHKVNLFG